MNVSGIVIHLSPDPARAREALAAIVAHPAIELGVPTGLKVPAVIDVEGRAAFDEVWQWLHDRDGVCAVDLVTVYFDPEDGARPCKRRRAHRMEQAETARAKERGKPCNSSADDS